MRSPKLDANVRALLEQADALNAPPLDQLTPQQARVVAANRDPAVMGAREDVHSVEDSKIPGPAGEIPIRIYNGSPQRPAAGMVFFHGGGWVVCGLDTHDVICRAIAKRAAATVVSVDYRLAPEHKFPAAVDDAYAATCWVAANAAGLGIDATRITVGGDSAGGNLATVVSMLARVRQGPAIACQALVYPVTDLGSLDTPSYAEFAEGCNLTKAMMVWFRNHYLASETDGLHPQASPLRAPDLHGLPPALILTAECDPLRDEAEAYATRLKAAGVEVLLHRYPGMIHPFFSMSGVIPQALQAFNAVARTVATSRPSLG
ncbi:MAG: alpha/beta hydrolase [Acidobacteria bacterium]|nr:alpha/beta hydrolase [Acidobacteriota bacterium]